MWIRNVEWASYFRTPKRWTFKDANVWSHAQSRKFPYLVNVATCVRPLQVAVLLCTLLCAPPRGGCAFVHFSVRYRKHCSSADRYFKPRTSGSKCKAAVMQLVCYHSVVAQLCPTLCNPTDCSLPGSSVRGIHQARILKWVVISFSRRSFPPRDRTRVSCIANGLFVSEQPRKPWSQLVLLYFSRYCTVRLKMLSLCLCLPFMY